MVKRSRGACQPSRVSARLRDVSPKTIGHKRLFNLELRAICETGDLMNADAIALRPIGHVDFGRVFEIVEEEDQGTPKLTDVILKTKTALGARDTVEFLAIYATEDYVRDVGNAVASENFEDLSLIESSETSFPLSKQVQLSSPTDTSIQPLPEMSPAAAIAIG